jgi:hypothetical protein
VDTAVHNPARIWKLYGTLSAKGDNTPERPHRMARILEAPSTLAVVDTALLEVLAAAGATAKAVAPSNGAPRGQSFDIERWIHDYHLEVDGPEPWQGGRKWVFRVCPWNSDHTNRSAVILQQASGAIAATCRHNGCQGKGWPALRDVIEPDWRNCQSALNDARVPRHDSGRSLDDANAALLCGGADGDLSECDPRQPTVASGQQDEPAGQQDRDKFTIERLTSREFDQGDFTQSYLVDDVLADRQPMVIAAALKSMKTTLAVALGISLALGRAFLGKFWVREAVNVLLISGESGLSTLQSAGRRIAESHEYQLADIGRLFWSTNLPRLGSIEHLEAVREALVRDEIAVLICDPLYFMLPGQDAGNLMIVGAYLRTLSALCEETGVTLIVVHHVKKTGIDDKHAPPELSQISWAGTAEWARQWLLLSRRENYVPGSGEHRLWMVTGGSAGHSGLHALDIFEGVGDARTWQVDVLSADEVRNRQDDAKENAKAAKQQVQLDRDMKAIVAAVVKMPGKQGTKKEIRTNTGRNGQAFDAAFAQAINLGHLILCEITKGNNRTYEGYKLAIDETA